MSNLNFHDAILIAKGCLDYGGGYRSDERMLRAFHHGIQTVINALEHTEESSGNDTQVIALHAIGKHSERNEN